MFVVYCFAFRLSPEDAVRVKERVGISYLADYCNLNYFISYKNKTQSILITNFGLSQNNCLFLSLIFSPTKMEGLFWQQILIMVLICDQNRFYYFYEIYLINLLDFHSFLIDFV